MERLQKKLPPRRRPGFEIHGALHTGKLKTPRCHLKFREGTIKRDKYKRKVDCHSEHLPVPYPSRASVNPQSGPIHLLLRRRQ